MEGRAIARPNLWGVRQPANGRYPFNGGPGNCPAKPPTGWASATAAAPPSMEGRAIARPNSLRQLSLHWQRNLQWRAGQLPGQTGRPCSGSDLSSVPSMEGRAIARPNRADDLCAHHASHLQWRAGQLPGQTGRPVERAELTRRPSMEGRAIARPNRSLNLVHLTCLFLGVCERSWKVKSRRSVDSVVKLRFALVNRASSGPRGLCAHLSARIR